MNVLKLMDFAAPYSGNFIASLLNLEVHFKKLNWNLVYLFPKTAVSKQWMADFNNEKRKVYFIDNSFFSKKIRYSNLKTISRIIHEEEINLIHTHFITYNYSLAFSKLIFLRIPVLGNFMNEFLPPRNLYRGFKVFVTKFIFDALIASSVGVKRSIIESGISNKRIYTVYNSLDTKHLEVSRSIDFKTNTGQKIILMFGWTYIRKGVDIAVKAISQLRLKNIDIHLVIAASGGFESIKNEIIKTHGEMPSWIRLAEPIEDISTYYNAADIFLSASREEGFAYSVLEALYCNPMVIISRIEGHPIEAPGVGIFDNENVHGLAGVIEEMCSLKENEKINTKVEQRNYVIDKFNINDWSESVINIYREIVK